MKVGIVGGGLMGMALAQRLAAQGHAVSVFEREPQLGGLASWHDFGQFVWDKFYHVILPTDVQLISFIQEIGLGSRLNWRETQTGFYVDQQFHSMNDNKDFLLFPPLSLWSKFRLACTLLYGSRINDWRQLEKVTVEDWLLKISGRATYEKMWKPLLLAKLGENYKRVSAVFIWSYIKRLFSARASSAKKEHMGYVSGGYRVVFERLQQLLRNSGGAVHTNTKVERISAEGGVGLWIKQNGQREYFDRVVCTSPVNVLQHLADRDLVHIDDSDKGVEYLGVICMVMVSKRPLSPYYVTNIADAEIPFTGVVGMSGVVSTDELNGYHLTYFPKYVLSTDPLLDADETELRDNFLAGVSKMYPDFAAENIVGVHINRATKVQPLQVLNYSQLVPKCVTQHEDFFVLNTSQFVNNTLNNNEVISRVNQFMDEYAAAFASAGSKEKSTSGAMRSVA